MRRRISLLIVIFPAVVMCDGVTATQPQPGRAGNVVLVTLDGVRWQEVFGGMDESLLRATTPKETNITTLPVYKQYSAATPRQRREKLMPFLWRTFAASHGFIAGDRTANSLVSVTNTHWFSYPGYSEMLTGEAHDDAIKSNDAIRNPFPTVLQFAKQRLALSPSRIATFASWGVFNEIVESEAGATTVNAGAEAYDAVMAACNLGLENWPRQWPSDEGVRDLVAIFRVGWAVIYEQVGQFVPRRASEILLELSCDDPGLQDDIRELGFRLRRDVAAGVPWRGRDHLDAIAILDTPSWALLVRLIDECPSVPANLDLSTGRLRGYRVTSEFEFISDNRQIAWARNFVESLPDSLVE